MIWLDNSAGVTITKNTANNILCDEDLLADISEVGKYMLSYATPDGMITSVMASAAQS